MIDKYNNKFFRIFNTLSEKERNEFCEFIQLSFINKPRLSGIIIEKIKSGSDLNGYLSEKYSARTLWNTYSELSVSIEQFMAMKEILEDKEKMRRIKRKQFDKRGLSNLLIGDYKNDIKKDLSSGFKVNTFEEIHKSAHQCLMLLVKKGLMKEFPEMYRTDSDYLVLNSLLGLINKSIETGTGKGSDVRQADLLIENIIGLIDFGRISEVVGKVYPAYQAVFTIFYNLSEVIRNTEKISSYEEAKKTFILNLKMFTDEYKEEIFDTMVNICMMIKKTTSRNVDSEVFQIFRLKLDQGLLNDIKSSRISENHFSDYVHISLNLNEDQWAEEFIEKYSPVLPEDIKENSINTASSFLHLHRKNYNAAIALISKVKRTYFTQDLDYFCVLISAFYESGDLVECLSVKNRFQEYMRNNHRFSGTYKMSSDNFIKNLTGLIRFAESGKRKILEDLEYDVVNMKKLIWRGWLKNRIFELKTG